jgi:hypothetical protein
VITIYIKLLLFIFGPFVYFLLWAELTLSRRESPFTSVGQRLLLLRNISHNGLLNGNRCKTFRNIFRLERSSDISDSPPLDKQIIWTKKGLACTCYLMVLNQLQTLYVAIKQHDVQCLRCLGLVVRSLTLSGLKIGDWGLVRQTLVRLLLVPHGDNALSHRSDTC